MVWCKVKNVSCESLKSNKPIWYSQCRRDVFGDKIFSDTPVGITTTGELNCFCGMFDQRGALRLISSWDHCQRFSPSQISDMLQAGVEPARNLSSGFAEWSWVLVITTTQQRQRQNQKNIQRWFKQEKCFVCNQIRKRKRKCRAYEVASRAEAKDEYVTSTEVMTVMKIQMICVVKTKLQQNAWKYKSVILISGLEMLFIAKPATIDLFVFIEKYRKKTLCLTRKYQASLQKKSSCFCYKGKLWYRKLGIFCLT